MRRISRILTPLLLSISLLVASCASQQPPSRFDQAQQQSSQTKSGQAVTKDATQGAKLNRFFPAPSDGYERVFTQEKKGFAQAKLKKGGKELAVLSINDISSIPATADKYKQSSKRIGGYPSVEQGTKATGILVSDRYQVKAQSRDPSFTASDREAWLQKFDLAGISRLK